MQDLTLVRLTEDKTRLVLVSDSGEEYSLPADDRLRAALRGDHARLGQLETRMESALRPRDIQARIRAGESPESVAQAAQTTVDRIMSYATPVLAERAHIADRAQRASLRRRSGEGPARILGETVSAQLRSRNVDPDSVEWDAWRREDGRWRVVADYRLDDRQRHAEFSFDVQGRYVVPDDDEARLLIGEQVTSKPAAPTEAQPAGRRLAAVEAAEELPLGEDAIELVVGADPARGDAVGADERTVDLTPTARELRRAAAAGAAAFGPSGDADWMATQASDRPRRATSTASAVDRATADAPAAHGDRAEEPARDGHDDHDASAGSGRASGQKATGQKATGQKASGEDEQADEAVAETDPAAEAAPQRPSRKSTRKGRRASVPSWDEIMFGGGTSE